MTTWKHDVVCRRFAARLIGVAFGVIVLLASTAMAEEPLVPVRLQLKWKHQFQFAGYYAAVAKGYYREAGLEVTLLEAPDDEEPAAVTIRGDAEFGIAASDLALLRGQGLPVVALAPIFQHSPLVFVAGAKAGIESIHDLKGKRVMVEAHAAELLAYLEHEGVSRSEFTELPHTFDPKMLMEGKVDAMSAYSTDEPFLLRKAGFECAIFTPRASGIDFYGDTLFTTEAMVRERPDVVKRFLEASLKGWRYALDHSDEMIDIILSQYSERHSREHLEYEAEMTRKLILPDVVEVGYMNPGRWRYIAGIYRELGMLKGDIDLDDFLYERFPLPGTLWLYVTLAVVLGVLGLVGLAAFRFYRLSVKVRRQSAELQEAFQEIKVLRGIIPICAHCKKIRDDQGYWSSLEKFISERSEAMFSHGICDECMRSVYGMEPNGDDLKEV